MNKKTITVDASLSMANNFLASKENSSEFKEGVCAMIEAILHKTGNYKGFQYLYWLEKGCADWEELIKTALWPEKLRAKGPSDDYIYGPENKGYGKFARKYY